MILSQLWVSTGLAIFMGWAYDIFGRHSTIIIGLLGTTVFLTLMPTFANFGESSSLSGLYTGRILLGIFTHLVIYNPLIQDFVKPKSRGMGYAVTICGSIIGLLLSYWLSCFRYTPEEEEPGLTIRQQFLVYGGMVTILSVLGLVLIKEPPQVRLVDPSKNKHEKKEPEGLCHKIAYVLDRMCQYVHEDMTHNLYYILAMGGVWVMVYTTVLYSMIWL